MPTLQYIIDVQGASGNMTLAFSQPVINGSWINFQDIERDVLAAVCGVIKKSSKVKKVTARREDIVPIEIVSL